MHDLEQLIRRGMDAWNARDEAGTAALSADDIRFTAAGSGERKGIQALHEFNRNWWTAFPDGKADITEFIAAGDKAVVRGTFKGTHTGVFKTPMGDIQPTNKPLHGKYIQIFHVRGEKVEEQHLMFDRLDVMEQLGLVPTPATA